MSQQAEQKLSRSKKWIDYSSEEENEHHEEEKLQVKENENQIQESKQPQQFEKKENSKPLLSTSHQPVKQHLLDQRKQKLQQLRNIRASAVWIELSVDDDKNLNYLNQKIDDLKKTQNKQIISIYPSRDNKKAFDLRLEIDLCEKWIVQGFDNKNLIELNLRKKAEKQRQQKYDSRGEDYRPVRQYEPQHTTSTRYQPKYVEKVEKKKYVEKNPLIEKIERKVEEQLIEKKLQKKGQEKKSKVSKFYSKNPFEEFNDSD